MPRYFGPRIVICEHHGDIGNMGRRTQSAKSQYEQKVQGVLHRIKSRKIGNALLKGINVHQPNANNCLITPTEFERPDKTMTYQLANGVQITYNPWTWNGKDKRLGIDPTGRGYQADDVLFHELIHAFLKLIGLFRSKEGGRNDKFHNREDFYAVMFTNIYRSERNGTVAAAQRAPLRDSHELQHKPIDPSLARSFDFYKKYSTEIESLFEVENYQPGKRALELFVRAVREIQCEFNPVRVRTKSGVLIDESDNPFGGWRPKVGA